MATSALLNHGSISSKAQGANGAAPMAASSENQGTPSGTKSSSAGITANDFLTLLVTEMKNQDPTANTDPNQYINQLVNVNSLQQLISINETLTATFGNSPASSAGGVNAYSDSTKPAASPQTVNPAAFTAVSAPTSTNDNSATTSGNSARPNVYTILSNLAHGNLSAPADNSAADRLAHALDYRSGSN